MFGISWTELLLIAVVAIVVIGPEQLPEVARTVGRFVRQGQRMVSEMREYMRMEELMAQEAPKIKMTDEPPTPVTAKIDLTKTNNDHTTDKQP